MNKTVKIIGGSIFVGFLLGIFLFPPQSGPFSVFQPDDEVVVICDGMLEFRYHHVINRIEGNTGVSYVTYLPTKKDFPLNHGMGFYNTYENLPINTNIPVTIIKLPNQDDDYDKLINVFIDQKKFSREEFDSISRCIKTSFIPLNQELAQSPHLKKLQFGGLAYINVNDYRTMIQSVNTAPEFVPPTGLRITEFGGEIIYKKIHLGDIFRGLKYNFENLTEISINDGRLEMQNARNSIGESIPEYVERVKKEISQKTY